MHFTTRDGVEAINIFSQHRDCIAIVLCEMRLPKLAGWDAFKIMKELYPRVKVVFASGYRDPDLKAEILKSGAIDFVQKPYDPDDILKHIRKVIDGSKS